jgi:hypothetical protein
VLQVATLRRCATTAREVLQPATLWRCVTTTEALQLAKLRQRFRYSDGSVATMDTAKAKTNLFFCFFFNNSWQVQESSTSCSAHEEERKKKQERGRKSFETCFELAFPSSSAFV